MKVLVCVIDKIDRLWTQCGRMNSRLKKPMTLFWKPAFPNSTYSRVSWTLYCNFWEDHCGWDLWIIGSKTKQMYVVHLLADWELVSTFACVSWQWHSPTAAVMAPQVSVPVAGLCSFSDQIIGDNPWSPQRSSCKMSCKLNCKVFLVYWGNKMDCCWIVLVSVWVSLVTR